jgi:hypothetical protein
MIREAQAKNALCATKKILVKARTIALRIGARLYNSPPLEQYVRAYTAGPLDLSLIGRCSRRADFSFGAVRWMAL